MSNQKVMCPSCGHDLEIKNEIKSKLVNESNFFCNNCNATAHGIFDNKGNLVEFNYEK